MRILHILSQLPDFTGSGKYIQAVMKCAAIKGHDNFLIAGIQGDFALDPSVLPAEKTFFVRFGNEDLPYPIPGMSDTMPYESTVFSTMTPAQIKTYQKAFREAILEAYEKFQPDILHSHHLWLASTAARALLPEIPMVTTCHGTCLRQFSLCPDLGDGVKESCAIIDKIMALSHFQKKQISEIYSIAPEKINVVGGGYDNNLFFSESKSMQGPVEILYAGKLSRPKGVPWLLQSLAELDHLPWILHLVGSGSGRDFDECLLLAKQLGRKVIVHGALYHSDLAALMRQSHLFILPSFFEGLPLVLLEALASGCRLITTSLPGTKEILGDLNNNMVEIVELPTLETIDAPFKNDMDLLKINLAQAIEKSVGKILQNRQPDEKSALKITQNYTWEKVFSRIERVYEKAMLA